MKASASSILNHPTLSNQQKAIGLLARFSELQLWVHETVCERVKKGDHERAWRAQDEITEAWKLLAPIFEVSGAALLNALDFHGYRVFMRDPSGCIFPVYAGESYTLEGDKIRVHAAPDKDYDYEDLKIASKLMHGSDHKSVRGTKVLLLNVNRFLTFRGIYPSVREL